MRPVIPAFTTLLVLGFAVGAVEAQDPTQTRLAFPAGSQYGYIDLARVTAESTDGEAATSQVQELTNQKLAEIQALNTELQTQLDSTNQELTESQQKLEQSQNVMSTEARLNLQRDISRLQVDIQRQTQDSQAEMERVSQDAEGEVTELQQQLQIEFEQKLAPAIEAVAMETGLALLFNVGQGGLIWANPDLDLTDAVIDKLDAAATGAP